MSGELSKSVQKMTAISGFKKKRVPLLTLLGSHNLESRTVTTEPIQFNRRSSNWTSKQITWFRWQSNESFVRWIEPDRPAGGRSSYRAETNWPVEIAYWTISFAISCYLSLSPLISLVSFYLPMLPGRIQLAASSNVHRALYSWKNKQKETTSLQRTSFGKRARQYNAPAKLESNSYSGDHTKPVTGHQYYCCVTGSLEASTD